MNKTMKWDKPTKHKAIQFLSSPFRKKGRHSVKKEKTKK